MWHSKYPVQSVNNNSLPRAAGKPGRKQPANRPSEACHYSVLWHRATDKPEWGDPSAGKPLHVWLCAEPRTEKKTIGHLDSAAITLPAKLYKRTRFKVILNYDEQNTQILVNTLFNHVTIASEHQPHERVPQKQKGFWCPKSTDIFTLITSYR